MRTTAAALTCCLLIVALTGATVVSGASSTPAPTVSDGAADLTAAQSDADGNLTSPETIEIRIQADGDARIVLSKTFPTATPNQTAAFERLATEFENGEHGRLGYGTYVAVVDDVAAETGRDMELVANGPTTTQEGDVGTLEYRFTWQNFATVNEANLTVGDAFQTGEGGWLGGLASGQQLRIQAPEGYSVTESPSGPQIDDDALVWDGPVTFEEDDLRATFEESSGSSTFGTDLLLGLVVALIVLTVAIFGWQIYSDRPDDGDEASVIDRAVRLVTTIPVADTDAERDTQRDGRVDADGDATDQRRGKTAVDDAEPSPAADATDQSAKSDTATGRDDETESVDPELLSDEERVQQLLEENGGRMKQANIVTETGWSNAKVSQLLSRMDEEERIDKLRIGRENLITLPDVDVTDQE